MAGLVLDRHRPTLGEATRTWPRLLRLGLLGLAAVLVLAVVVSSLRGDARGTELIREAPPAFNLAHRDTLARVEPRHDQVARLEQRRADGLFLQSFAVAPLALPAYRGEVTGVLPVAADATIATLRRRHPGFRLVGEGKARIVDVPGYAILFEARDGERRIFGRTVLLPEPVPGARTGARLDLLSTYAAGVSAAEDVGTQGQLERPYRTFRLGSDPP